MSSPRFLSDRAGEPWRLATGSSHGLRPVDEWTGRDARYPLIVDYATAETRPRADEVRRCWKARHGNAPNPLLLVVAYPAGEGWKAAVCGPAGDEPPVESDLDLGQVERLAAAALDEPTRHAATRFLSAMWAELETELPGVRNAGMLASHELRDGVPLRADWSQLCEQGRTLLDRQGRGLVEQLGFTVSAGPTSSAVLEIGSTKRAVAVFLDEGEEFEHAADRFGATSPVSYALAIADRENLPWVVATRGRQIRVYSSRPDVGVGRKGRAETYVEANLALLPEDRAGYLPLLFSADALVDDGTFEQVLESSRDYAADLSSRLRDRVYEEVVPRLALALARRRDGEPDEGDLEDLYEQSLTILFRLLFVAYAEDKDLLPYRSHGAYREHALKTLARSLADRSAEGPLVFDESATDLWDDVTTLWLAVDKGNTERGVPRYNGGLFSSDAEINAAGAALAEVELTNAEFGPALAALLVDVADGIPGPVDFRSLSVREFGTIYEGLLESSLSVAPADLTLDSRSNYVPASGGAEPVVSAGEVYFHNRSGARKSSGSYFTKPFAVEHLLDHALEPALTDHLARVSQLIDRDETARAADALFDFRCVDLAMGSGHFLVAAVDRIEARLSAFLALCPIPHVTAELEHLRGSALDALGQLGEGVEIEHASLLRRQVARRCVYGVDRNPVAVELARLGIWIHTFVPGLPLSFLDHSLVCGDSLIGVATLDEAVEALDPEHVPGQVSLFRDRVLAVLGRAESALTRLAHVSEASRSEIDASREAQHEALRAVQPARDLFDLIVGKRFGITPLHHAPDETELASHPEIARARALSAEVGALHFPIAFPEVFLRERAGFDCVIGNPPWDKVLFEAQQFWVARAPGLNAVPQSRRSGEIEKLREMRPEDAAQEIREKAERERFQTYAEATFVLRGRGHYDLAKFFVERALALCGDTGNLGYLLPRQSLVLGGWAKLRRALANRARLSALQARNTRGWVFDNVEYRYMVVLLTRVPRERTEVDPPGVEIWPDVTSIAALRAARPGTGTHIRFSELEGLSDSLVIPWMNDSRAGAVFDLYRGLPSLSSGRGWLAGVHDARWDFRSSGPDSGIVVPPADGMWKALMTRHVDAYQIAWDESFRTHLDPSLLIRAGRGVEVSATGEPHLGTSHPVIIVRHPSRNDDARTLIATLLPKSGVLHNKGYVHAIRHERDVPVVDVLAFLGFINSLACDWWARRFVDRHVTAPIINNLRLPAWDEPQRARIAVVVSELLRRRDPSLDPVVDLLPSESSLELVADVELSVELEVASLRGVGIDRAGVEVILDDFSASGCSVEVRQGVRGRFEA
jgi:hypothetical protein